MALLSKRSRTDDVSDPAKLLVVEHQKVEKLFAQIEEASSPNRKVGLVAQLDAELSAHMAAEEQLVYPFVRAEVDDGDELIDRAEQEHAEAREALAAVVGADVAGPQFPKALKTLKKLVMAHVKQEEKRILPTMAQDVDGARLGELRGSLEELKFTATPKPVDAGTPRTSSAASSNGDYVVERHADGRRWQAKRNGAARASRVFETKKEAQAFVRERR